MDITQINEVLGMASSAVGLTGRATSTVSAIKGLLEKDGATDNAEASKLLNDLASELTSANMTNVELSNALKSLSQEIQRQNEFEQEKARYELFETSVGDLVFQLRRACAEGQPMHYACPVCMQKHRLISFVTGMGDYKFCQAHKHQFQFSDTPLHYDDQSY